MNVTFTATDLTTAIAEAQARVRSAGERAMRTTMRVAEDAARLNHLTLSNWKNVTGNLETTITGYVAGDSEDQVYRHAGEVDVLPNRSRRALSGYFRPDFAVSPPVEPVPDAVLGILHHYMTYGNRLPTATGMDDIDVTTLRSLGGTLLDTLGETLARELDQ